ncbi:hypothetical protein F2P81_013685 [Scophthalmus maximus]|uniref:Uncharacterized protein n=1 Tax=Scophthalmus maximus TaxID=52904 RepID=A0A6A4SLZ8_SCOMX|nr:hypothetical protein F2P81_013685 [Scophthalmus maximus]
MNSNRRLCQVPNLCARHKTRAACPKGTSVSAGDDNLSGTCAAAVNPKNASTDVWHTAQLQQQHHWPGFSGSPIRLPVLRESWHFLSQLNGRRVGLNEEPLTSEFLDGESESLPLMSMASMYLHKKTTHNGADIDENTTHSSEIILRASGVLQMQLQKVDTH